MRCAEIVVVWSQANVPIERCLSLKELDEQQNIIDAGSAQANFMQNGIKAFVPEMNRHSGAYDMGLPTMVQIVTLA